MKTEKPRRRTSAERETAATLELVRSELRLQDGKLYWRETGKGRKRDRDGRAGNLRSSGYRCVQVGGAKYYEHRLIFALFYGRWPADQIDHVDGMKDNNHPENLREVSHSQNAQAFQKTRSGASSMYRGVYWDTPRKKWHAQIRKGGNSYFLGYFTQEDDAASAFNAAALRMGFFPEALNTIPEAARMNPFKRLDEIILDRGQSRKIEMKFEY